MPARRRSARGLRAAADRPAPPVRRPAAGPPTIGLKPTGCLQASGPRRLSARATPSDAASHALHPHPPRTRPIGRPGGARATAQGASSVSTGRSSSSRITISLASPYRGPSFSTARISARTALKARPQDIEQLGQHRRIMQAPRDDSPAVHAVVFGARNHLLRAATHGKRLGTGGADAFVPEQRRHHVGMERLAMARRAAERIVADAMSHFTPPPVCTGFRTRWSLVGLVKRRNLSACWNLSAHRSLASPPLPPCCRPLPHRPPHPWQERRIRRWQAAVAPRCSRSCQAATHALPAAS